MNINSLNIDNIELLLGSKCAYQGRVYIIIEVLSDPIALVLEAVSGQAEIQPDAYGNALRETHELITIPVLSSDEESWHPAFLDLGLFDHLHK